MGKSHSLVPKTYAHRFTEYETLITILEQKNLKGPMFPEIDQILLELKQKYVQEGKHFVEEIYVKVLNKYFQLIYLNDQKYDGSSRLHTKNL